MLAAVWHLLGPYCPEEECVRQAGISDALVLTVGDESRVSLARSTKPLYVARAPGFVMLQADSDRPPVVDEFVSGGSLQPDLFGASQTAARRAAFSARLPSATAIPARSGS